MESWFLRKRQKFRSREKDIRIMQIRKGSGGATSTETKHGLPIRENRGVGMTSLIHGVENRGQNWKWVKASL